MLLRFTDHSSNYHVLFVIPWVEYMNKITVVNISLDASIMDVYGLQSGISLRDDARRSGSTQKYEELTWKCN